MGIVTLTNEQHGEFQNRIAEALEAIENAETLLANLTVDIDELGQDLNSAIEAAKNITEQLEDF